MGRRINASEEDFGELLRNGLSSTRSYIVLKEKNRSPIDLRMRPHMGRINSSVIYIGGKIAAFPDETHEKWAGLSERARIEALGQAWNKMPQDRVSSARVGSYIGFLVAAGSLDRETFTPKFDKGHVIHKLLDGIEEALNIEIASRDEVTAYLSMFYHTRMADDNYLFGQHWNSKALPPRTVGKRTEVLLGQSFTNGGEAIEPFMDQYELATATSDIYATSDSSVSDDETEDEDEDEDDE